MTRGEDPGGRCESGGSDEWADDVGGTGESGDFFR